MIQKYPGITIAEYFFLNEIKKDEIDQADIVIIHEKVPSLGLYGSSQISWQAYLPKTNDPYCLIRSKRERKAARENLATLLEEGYTVETLPVTPELYQRFSDLYAETTGKKERFHKVDLHEQIYSKVLAKIPCFISCISKNGTLQSGLAFSFRGKKAMVSVGAKQKNCNLRGGFGGILEVELVRFCLENNIEQISHGKEKSPSGMVNSVGQFVFKARYGYNIFPSDNWATFFILNPKVGLSDWLTLNIIDSELTITIISSETSNVNQKEYLTKNIEKVRVIDAFETAEKHRQDISQLLTHQSA